MFHQQVNMQVIRGDDAPPLHRGCTTSPAASERPVSLHAVTNGVCGPTSGSRPCEREVVSQLRSFIMRGAEHVSMCSSADPVSLPENHLFTFQPVLLWAC